MYQCPLCGSENKSLLCKSCGFDGSQDRETYPTLARCPATPALSLLREEAKAIEALRKSIIAVSANEEPYDIFICYKETDEKGDRTLDSVLAQDLGKVGATQDLLRGIEKLLPRQTETVKETVVVQQATAGSGPTVDSYLERAFMFLEDGDWESAKEYCEKVLDIAPKNAKAYLGKLLADLRVKTQGELRNQAELFDGNVNYQKALRFADPEVRELLERSIAAINKRKEEERIALEKSKEQLLPIRNKLRNAQGLLALSFSHAVGLRADGTVVATGYEGNGQCNVSDWKDIVAVSCGSVYTVGLKANGTVVATGEHKYGECNVSNWRDIVAVSCSSVHTIGIKADGTVVATGYNKNGECNVSNWRDIVAVSCGVSHTVGLKTDGTVVTTGKNDDGRCNVSNWRDIVAVSCGDRHTVGLKADGTVVATGKNDHGQCEVDDWREIVAVSCGGDHTVGLKADGTVVATGYNKNGECNVSDWKDIVAVSCGSIYTVGLKANGTVVATDLCDVRDWKLFEQYENLSQEREIGRKKQEEAQKRRQAGLCQHCGGRLKGLFSKKCVSCGKPKDY